MSDYISRRDAINAIYHHFPHLTMDECRAVLHEVPSVQSGNTCENTCDYTRMSQENGVIYRQDAIDTIRYIQISSGITKARIISKLKNLPFAQPDKDMIHLQKEQAYMQGWEDGRKALREEIWEDGRDRLD